MSLNVGARLGPYEIRGPLGAGGMGEVYRAHDTHLHRDVALKILPEHLSAEADRVARFKREAQLLAALNHSNIAAIYRFEESRSGDDARAVQALVLELVEGPTLADRLARGAMPLSEALPVARQIAEALEAAHDQGIIHRDLKPANIKLRDDGRVKVLDFGLAKALDPRSMLAKLADASQTPTFTPHGTRSGMILGTPAYMAPEQARGKPVDKRADIWAFGCVLFEMLSGHTPFAGDSESDLLAAVLRDEVNWQALPVNTPAGVQRLLRRCLDRDPVQRLRDAGDARIEIQQALTEPAPQSPAQVRTFRQHPGLWQRSSLAHFSSLLFGETLRTRERTLFGGWK